MFCHIDRRNFTRALPRVLLLLALAFTIGFALLPSAVSAIAPDPVTAAWRAARARRTYHFNSDVVQSTTPSATVANIGRSSRAQGDALARVSHESRAALAFGRPERSGREQHRNAIVDVGRQRAADR